MSELTATPFPAHLGSEFLLWLWWRSELDDASFPLPAPVGRVSAWIDGRIVFRTSTGAKPAVVLTSENPSSSREAKVTLQTGKVLHEVCIGVKRDDREYLAIIQADGTVKGLKMPQVLSEKEEEAVIDRLFLYEEFMLILKALFAKFSEDRALRWTQCRKSLAEWLGD